MQFLITCVFLITICFKIIIGILYTYINFAAQIKNY